MADVVTAYLRAVVGFAHSRLAQSVATTTADAGALAGALRDGASASDLKARLNKLTEDIKANAKLVKGVVPKINEIHKLASESAKDLDEKPFTVETAARVATRLATAMMALDEAIQLLADKAVEGETDSDKKEKIKAAIVGIKEPWVAPFRSLGAGAGKAFDSFALALGVPNATKGVAERLTFDRANFRLALELTSSGGDQTPVPAFPQFALTKTKLEAFLSWGKREAPGQAVGGAVLGLRVTTVLKPGLTADPMLAKVIPGKKPAETQPTTITLDTAGGLYLGDNPKNQRAVLPAQFDWPGVELRELALVVRKNAQKETVGLDLTSIVAGKLGDVVGAIVEGGGITMALDGKPTDDAAFPLALAPRLPDAVGVKIKTGVVDGGGFFSRKGKEYGGVIDVRMAGTGVTAIGIISVDPFSMVLVMGIHFSPAVELSWGFTLNGVGGILALDRAIDTDALRKGLREHAVENLLFPEDPVAAAPKILKQLGAIFPAKEDAFVVGPIIEVGWGSQARVIEARLGVVLSLPDPRIVLLGALRVRAPSKFTPITDLRAEIYGEINPDYLVVIVSLNDSKIANVPVSGEMGFYVRWGGADEFALSVGGWHPKYKEAPSQLAELKRVTVDLSPPVGVKIVVAGYFALVPGALMFGVHGEISAKVGPAAGRAWVTIDAIFRWVPRVSFEASLSVGITITVFGKTFANVQFNGQLTGVTPWTVHGTAVIDVWWFPTIDFDVGPYEWGDKPAVSVPAIDILDEVRTALSAPEAWRAQLPAGTDVLVRLASVDVAEETLVAHPMAGLEVTQSRIPLETHIARLGSAPVASHRVHLGAPTTGASPTPLAAVSTTTAAFAPGQFLDLTEDELISRAGFEDFPAGCRMVATRTPSHGPAVDATVKWRTYFPGRAPVLGGLTIQSLAGAVLDHGAVSRAARERGNPYLEPPPRVPFGLQPELVVLRRADDLEAVAEDLRPLTQTEAARVGAVLESSGQPPVTAVAVGVEP